MLDGGRLLRWQVECYQHFWQTPGPVTPPDPAAMAVAMLPALTEAAMHHVTIETKGEHTRGMTVVDRRLYRGRRGPVSPENCNVVTRIDTNAYRRLFLETYLGQ